MIREFKEEMKQTFEINDLRFMHNFLGIEVNQNQDRIFISQKKYTQNLLQRFKMNNCKAVSTPIAHNKSLLYLTTTRLDIMYATSLVLRFMQKPSQKHYGATRRILRYLLGTKDHGIYYKSTEDPKLPGYIDSGWAGSINDMKSTSGYTFLLGSRVFSWASKNKKTVAQSSTEAGYVAATNATSQAIWLRKIFEDIG
ncbi:hypothetical protein AAHE18_07G136400 [Arachis hypogaea]